MNRNTTWGVAIAIIIIVGAAVLFSGNKTAPQGTAQIPGMTDAVDEDENENENQNESVASKEVSVGGSATVSAGGVLGAVKEFVVMGNNYTFAPSVIRVKKGDTVKIVFKNSSGFHDWKIDEFNAATKKISGGQEDVVVFVADKAGTFEYYCSVGQHRAMGMKGQLIVD